MPLSSLARLLSLASSRKEGEGHRAKQGNLPHLFPSACIRPPSQSPPKSMTRLEDGFSRQVLPGCPVAPRLLLSQARATRTIENPQGKSLSCWFRYIGLQDGCYFVPVCTSKTVVWNLIIAGGVPPRVVTSHLINIPELTPPNDCCHHHQQKLNVSFKSFLGISPESESYSPEHS